MAFISFIITLVFSRCPIYWTLCTCDMFLLFLMIRLVLTFALFCRSFYGRKSSQTTTTKSTSNISAIPNADISEEEFSSSSDEEEESNVDDFELESETDEEIIHKLKLKLKMDCLTGIKNIHNLLPPRHQYLSHNQFYHRHALNGRRIMMMMNGLCQMIQNL